MNVFFADKTACASSADAECLCRRFALTGKQKMGEKAQTGGENVAAAQGVPDRASAVLGIRKRHCKA